MGRRVSVALALALLWTAAEACDSGYIRCASGDRCVKLAYLCDGDNDCADMSDEHICSVTRSDKQLRHFDATAGQADTPEIITFTETTFLPTTTLPPPPPPNNVEESEALGQKFARTFNDTLHHPRCPKLYTSVGNKCLSLLYFVKVGWGEARALCSAVGGELARYPSASDGEFAALLKYLREIQMTTDFWVGGRYTKDTEAWTWLDDAPMDLGSPYWAVRHTDNCSNRQQESAPDGKPQDVAYWTNTSACYHYEQAPRRDSHELCAAVTFRHYFYMSDEDCLSVRSPLCEHVPSTTHDLTLSGGP
uniref:C-type lectin containing low-density lipoprotein receptor domain n=1 Tax=Penaeus merguiensis TaxID=71412 RepID=A0A2H4V106_PENME|nr:C-type lectin containing low-density lipoprotein receptor domain [Penaeus merguiensis]